MTQSELTTRVRSKALELGFEAVGIASVEPLEAAAHFEAWLAAGCHGEMDYLATDRERGRRADPNRILKNLRAVVCVAMCYGPDASAASARRLGRIARYAVGEDYHRIMRDRLRELERFVEAEAPGARALWYSDTGAILERGWAERAGLGWIGKHSGLLSPRLGSWFLLGEVLVDVPLDPDAPFALDHCGTCTRCLDACPTQAIVAPYRVDARRCISYLTIELRGPIPHELRPLVGEWIFGCDVCQEVCPWNRFAGPAREARLHARGLEGWTLERFLELTESEFVTLFAGSPIRRAQRGGFLRNVCVALGNRRDPAAAPALVRALERDPEPLVRAHAAWALGELGRSLPHDDARARTIATALDRARSDPDTLVAAEAAEAREAPGASGPREAHAAGAGRVPA